MEETISTRSWRVTNREPILLWASTERMCTPSPTVAWPPWSAACPVPGRPERANLKAHQAVLNRLLADTTPLPMAFGTVASSPQAIHKILLKNRRAFGEQLARVAGKVEMGLRVSWDVPNIFEYLVNIHAELRSARDRLMSARHEFTQEEKIELGRMFDRLLNDDREATPLRWSAPLPRCARNSR